MSDHENAEATNPPKELPPTQQAEDIEKILLKMYYLGKDGKSLTNTELYKNVATIQAAATQRAIEELEQAHRAGGTTDFDNVTDEWIDERVEQLRAQLQEGGK